MKAYLSAFLLLLTVGKAQTLLFEDFEGGVIPNMWAKRFGTVKAVDTGFAFSFNNRASGNDSFSAPMDLSGMAGDTLTLSFDFKSDAFNHALLVGLSPDTNSAHYFLGSPAAVADVGLVGSFVGTGGWTHVSVDISPWLTAYSPSQLTGMRIALESWNSGTVSSSAVWIDNLSVSYAAQSAIPEPSTYAGLAGLVALLLAGLKRKTL